MAVDDPHGAAVLDWGWRVTVASFTPDTPTGAAKCLGIHQVSLSSQVFRLLTDQLLPRGQKGAWLGLFRPSWKQAILLRPILSHLVLERKGNVLQPLKGGASTCREKRLDDSHLQRPIPTATHTGDPEFWYSYIIYILDIWEIASHV